MPPARSGPPRGRPIRGRHRDRRGHGVRGPLVPAGVPLALTRSEQFDEIVMSSLQRLLPRWRDQLDCIEVVVEDAPDPDLTRTPAVGLGRSEPAEGDRPARIVVYRRALEARARGQRDREDLVHEVLVERLAELLGLDPGTVDPDLGE